LERENRELKEKLAELYLEVDDLKNSETGYAGTKASVLRDHRGEFVSIAQGTQIMNLAPSSYYYQAKSDAEDQACRDPELKDHIEWIEGEFRARLYRLGRQLRLDGILVSQRQANPPCAATISALSHSLAEF
jgi:hypothetical protein